MRDRSDLLLLPLLGLIGWLHRAALRLPLRNADDWFHVDVAAGMLAGDGAAWRRAIFGYGETDSLRPTPWLLWMADVAAFGFDGAGYYATNLLLHLGIVAGVWALVRSLGGGAGGALVAGAAVGLNIGTGQGTYYLSARDDQLMTLLVLVLLVAWPRLRGSWVGRWGAAGLYLAAVLCKPPGVAALGLVWGIDRVHGRSPWRHGLPFVAAVAAWGAVLYTQVGPTGRLLSGGVRSWAAPLQALETLVAPGHALGMPNQTVIGGALPWFAVLVGLLVFARGRAARDLLAAAALWLGCTLIIPGLYLLGQSADFNDTGRQMLLPSVGLALAAAAAGPVGRRGLVYGIVGAALFVRGFLPVGPSFLDRSEPTIERFVDALEHHEGPLAVALQRPNAALVTLLTSGALDRLSGSGAAVVALQGGERAWRVVREPYGYGRLVVAEWPEGSWLAEGFGEAGDPPAPWPTYAPWSPAAKAPGEVAQRWDFSRGAGGWGPWPPGTRGHLGLPAWRAGAGFEVESSLRMPEGEAATQLALPHKPGVLRSPTLEIDPRRVCSVELELDAAGVRALRGRGASLVPEGRFAYVTWGGDARGLDLWRGSALAPIQPDGRALVRLDRSPAWADSGTVRRLAVLATNAPGRVVIRSLTLRWCASGSSDDAAGP